MGVDETTGARVNLIASMIVRNELGRYLPIVIPHLLAFCDEIRVRDDGSDDGTLEWLERRTASTSLRSGAQVLRARRPRKERPPRMDAQRRPDTRPRDRRGRDRDGRAKIRAACETDLGGGSWSLHMEEVWNADVRTMWTREDGGWRRHWRRHPVACPAQPGSMRSPRWRITDRKLACGREPQAMRRYTSVPTGSSVLHLGWLNRDAACRAARPVRRAR